MGDRTDSKFRPGFEPLEEKKALSAGVSAAALDGAKAKAEAPHAADTQSGSALGSQTNVADLSTTHATPDRVKPNYGFLVYRVTNPKNYVYSLKPPYQQVLVQTKQPVPGQTYNVLQIAVKNNTAQTFNANDGFTVRLAGEHQTVPVLTGTETWQPNQVIVFYVLTKKYYPLKSQISGGFIFNMGGAFSTAIPGPSGIFLRIKYDPTTFPKTLDWIVTYGQGNQTGNGNFYGIPNTAIWAFVSSTTRRNDFGGYF